MTNKELEAMEESAETIDEEKLCAEVRRLRKALEEINARPLTGTRMLDYHNFITGIRFLASDALTRKARRDWYDQQRD